MASRQLARAATTPDLHIDAECPCLSRTLTAPIFQPPDCGIDSDATTELASEVGSLDSLDDREEQTHVTRKLLFLVDWDDTVLPTTWLSKLGLMDPRARISATQRAQLSRLAQAVTVTLETAIAHGKVVIVTNAGEGWVQQSCLHFLPSLAPLLQQMHIVSARSAFEPLGIHDPVEWKRRAFVGEVEALASAWSGDMGLNLIAMGDSEHEHKAVIGAAQTREGCLAKSLRLVPKPTVVQLIEEHELVAGTLEDIILHDEDVDIEVPTST